MKTLLIGLQLIMVSSNFAAPPDSTKVLEIEAVSELKIQADNNLAQAWMDYPLFLDDTFNHCGVNSIQLAFDGAAWKIIQIMDSRRKDKCN
jgi:hypothetical protein